MKKLIFLLLLVPLLFTSCQNNVHSEYEGYEYVISEKEDYYTTYSIFGENASDLITDPAKEQIGIYYVSIFTKDELRRITNKYSTIMNILGNDVFEKYYLGISQRSEETDSLYALNCVYDVSVKLKSPMTSGGYIEYDEFYKSFSRYYPKGNQNIEINSDYILDIFLYPKEDSSIVNEGIYDFMKLEEEYDPSFVTEKNNVSYLFNQKEQSYTVYKVTETVKECVILNQLNKKPVTKINRLAFYGNQYISEIVIPSSIESIGESAFNMCASLKKVSFEEDCKIKEFSKKMFYGCGLLEEIDIPSTIVKIQEGCFYNCISLETINFSEQENLKEIGMMAFKNCTSLRKVELPNGLETLDDNAFYNTYLNEISMPKSLVNVGIDIFAIEGTYAKTIKVKIYTEEIPSSWYIGWDNGANIEIEYIK